MVERVPPVQFELGVGDELVLLGRGQVSLVVRVRHALAAVPTRPARTPAGDRSCGLPSYSCRPAYSRTSETSRSQTARNRGESSMAQTLPEAAGHGPSGPAHLRPISTPPQALPRLPAPR